MSRSITPAVTAKLRISLVDHPRWWREMEVRPGGYTVTGGAPGRRSLIGADLCLSVALRRLCASIWSSGIRLWEVDSVGEWQSWRCLEPDLGEVVLSRGGGRWTFSTATCSSSVDGVLARSPFPTLLKGWADDSSEESPSPASRLVAPSSRTLRCAVPLARNGRWEEVETWLDLPQRRFRVGDRWGRGETAYGALRGWVRASGRWLGDPWSLLPNRRFTNAAARAAEHGIRGPLARVALPDGRSLEIVGAAPVGTEGLHTALVRVDGRVHRALGEGPCVAVLEALRTIGGGGAPPWTGAWG